MVSVGVCACARVCVCAWMIGTDVILKRTAPSTCACTHAHTTHTRTSTHARAKTGRAMACAASTNAQRAALGRCHFGRSSAHGEHWWEVSVAPLAVAQHHGLVAVPQVNLRGCQVTRLSVNLHLVRTAGETRVRGARETSTARMRTYKSTRHRAEKGGWRLSMRSCEGG